MKSNISIILTLILAVVFQCQAVASLRGNTAVSSNSVGEKVHVAVPTVDNNKPQQDEDKIYDVTKKVEGAKSEDRDLTIKADENGLKTLDQDSVKIVDGDANEKRELGGEAVWRLFETPIGNWTLSQFALLFVLLWLASYFLNRCCPCFYDLLACFCCYELFCDPDPAGFMLC